LRLAFALRLRIPSFPAVIRARFLNFDQNLKLAAVLIFVLILLPPSFEFYS
jgi:hypothetical protein